MYEGMNKAFGPSTIKIAPLKSATGDVITDHGKQMERWAENYQQLYSRENVVTDTVLKSTTPLPEMKELDALPTVDELSKAIDSLARGKAPGSDGIPPEVIKADQKSVLLDRLHELLLQCWEVGTVPQDMRDANIITLYKNKGDRCDCNNFRGISLLSIVGKVFARVVLNRLQVLAERVYPEVQCGFRSQRSTINMIFSLRQLQEKCREQRQPLYIDLFNLARLRAKTKVCRVQFREMLFADDAALTAHTEEALQHLISSFARASDEFGLTMSLKKSSVMGQDVSSTPCISRWGLSTSSKNADLTLSICAA